ncbi:MAG: fatty acid desaturase [Burkholderiaceae bacterium]
MAPELASGHRSFRLKADALLPLSAKTDAAGTFRAAVHLGAIVALASLVWLTLPSGWAVLPIVLLGYLQAFLFSILHETAHRTAFRTRGLNTALGHFAGFLLLLPYEYYRAFHWDHHRYTQNPERDPELAISPPTSLASLMWVWSGIPMWIGRLRMLLTHGLQSQVAKPWVKADQTSTIAREARWYLAGYSLVAIAAVSGGLGIIFWLWLLPMTIGYLFLRPYLLSEHTGCENSSDMLANTRTTYCNGFIRFFAWNMPYHAEHHAYPAVPFHALPALNVRLASHLRNTERGYTASTRAVVRHVLSQEAAASAAKAGR